ncbi:hypothetical protein BLNAU_22084 [Blattamonas nauphoetae]|uniref:Protein kinase domain-containing protein n=1 Tax=Blattamonas nauphoetae TaxID=2049346 RepID=A0ABQ9WUI8_9EUKA|nr:hypothetical protein BLNAU_22084 [Blattamonas nauphoetae]
MPVYAGCLYLYRLTTSTVTINACSFDDWYPGNDTYTKQFGGAIGTHSTSAPLQITHSNFTLNGHPTNKNNGGFLSFYSSTSSNYQIPPHVSTISNCRFIGDTKTTGLFLRLAEDHGIRTGSFSVTDTQILNINSRLSITIKILESSSGFTRTEISNSSIDFNVQCNIHPVLFVDSKLDRCPISVRYEEALFLFSGTSFTGKSTNTTISFVHLSETSHVVFHKCDFTDCSPASASTCIIYSKTLPSLVLDTCSFTNCSGGKSVFEITKSYSSFYFCSFTNVTGSTANIMYLSSNYANFFEGCRFDLEETNMVDVHDPTSQFAYLNDTVVFGCTSNRQMYLGYSWWNKQEFSAVQIVNSEAEKNEMRVGTWPTEPEEPSSEESTETESNETEEEPEQPIPLFSSLSDALGNISTSSPLDTVITFSNGIFTEDSPLSVSQIVEIVGDGSNSSDVHSTQLKTDGFVSKSNGKLTLRSLRLVPSSPSSVLGSTEDNGGLIMLNVIVEDISDQSVPLFRFAAGSSEIRHSTFKNINSTESLIFVSQTSSLVITNILFMTITRTSLEPTPYESTQCASCIEGKTSGRVKVIYCRFGACTTNGRAGAIDLVKNHENSAFEMSSSYFDQNKAGEEVPDNKRGDDVVLKSFEDSNTILDLSTIQSFPSTSSILIDSQHAIVPPPALIYMNSAGVLHPLTWSYTYGRIHISLLETYSLQYLLEHRFRNNSNTKLTILTSTETLAPFIFQNSTVQVDLSSYTSSIISVEQQDKVFITIQNASLSFSSATFAFGHLTKTAFTCDKNSSISLSLTAFTFTNPTLTHSFIDSVGPLVRFEYQDSKQPITLDNIPFIRLIRTEQDASLSFNYVTPLLADSLTAPFIECVGAETFQMEGLTLSSSHLNSASFVSAKDSALTLRWIKIQLLKSTVDGAFLHLDSCSLTSDYDTGNLSSGVRGGLVYCQNSTVEFEDLKSNSCSAKQGGFLFSKECNTTIFDAVFTNCEAEEGGIACIVSSYLRLTSNSFVSNSAKRGGVFWIDFGDQSTSSVYSLSNSNYTSNTARDEDENGVDSGKGGAIYVKGTTTAKTPFSTSGHYEGNTAAVGNDVFVEEAVLGEIGPDLLSNGYAESYSRFPHLVIENYDGDEDEITRISNLVPYPSIRVSKSGKDDPACRWSNTYSAYDTKEGIMFTITDESRLTAVRVKFLLKSSHQVVTVNSKDGRLAMQNCFVLIESDLTTSKSPINSVGSSLALNNVSFAPTLTASISTLSAPLVHYAPTPSAGKELGSGSCDITNCTLTNLTFPKTTMFVIETSGQVSFLLQPIYRVTTDLEHGKFISLKGQSFKQQIQPSLWHSNPSTSDLPYFIGEDVSMDEDDKWRTGSLVYWLISPSIEIFIGSVENAVDHPNCGSSTFQCTTLDSAFKSAGLNDLSTLSLSTSTSLSSELSAKSLWVIKSSSATKQEIEFDKTGSIEVASSGSKLSFESIVFTVAPTCQSATLIVIEEGEISFSSCLIGTTISESTLVLPTSTATLIEVQAAGTLTLTDTLIQHIAFSHATLGSAICLHLGATISSSGTKPITDISSQAAGSHVLVLSSTELESSSIESIATQFTTWGPTLTTNGARFSKAQIDEFVEIDTGRVDELIYHWHPYEGITMFVDSEGRDHPKCGLSALPCSSLSANVENVGDGEAIVVCSALTETTGFIATKDLSVKTSDDTKQTLSVSSSTTFTSRSSSLAFTNLKFVPLTSNPSQNVEPLGRTDSLFVVESGSIELTDCSLSSFVIANKPLITHMSGSLTLESCEISSITRSSGNGTVLDTKMEDITSISLNEVTFSSMSSSKESSLLALSFPSLDEDEPAPLFDFTLTNLHFVEMTGNEDELGDWISENDTRFEGSYTETTPLNHFWSFDAFHELPASLLFYLLPSTGSVGVSSSGYDMGKCGSNSVWCSTIERSLTRLTPQNTKKIVVMDEVLLSTSIELPDELTFAGNPNEPSTCVVSAAGSFVSEGIDFTTFSKLIFSLPSTQTAEAVIVHSSITLTLSHLELSSTAESSACFLKVGTGSADLSDIKIRSEMAQNSILFSFVGKSLWSGSENGKIGMVGEISTNNVNISECSGTTFITAKDGDELSIQNSVFSSLTPSTTFNEAESSDLCVWETSLIDIDGTPTSLSHADLTNIPQGAISISDAPLTLTGCKFSSNSPSNLEWPSVHRNVKCSNGTVSIAEIGGGDGVSPPHHWIWTDECTVTKDNDNVEAPLFVPTLVANESTSTLDRTLKEYSVKVVGTTMVPCGLKLEVFEAPFESKANTAGDPIEFDISSLNPTKWTETELSFVLPQSSLSELDKKSDIRCRLLFGDDQTTDSFSLTGSSKSNMSQGGVVTSIVVPIVVVIIVALLLLIILIVLCRRRKTKKEAGQTSQELDTTDVIDVMKEDGDAQDDTIKPIFGASKDHSKQSSLLMVSDDNGQDSTAQRVDPTCFVPVQYVSAIGCDGENSVISVDSRNTLYHRLHVEKKKDLAKRTVALQIVKGLERMVKERPSSEIFSKLSPHWIIMDYTDNVFLRVESQLQQQSQGGEMKGRESRSNEDRRWNAPEQETKEGENETGKEEGGIDEMKASVFRLGLVLWEIETELVPFGELDAVNASRQMKAGVLPLIHNWEDESFADLVRECLSLSPDDRPTLADVKSRLSVLSTQLQIPVQPVPNEPVDLSGVTG